MPRILVTAFEPYDCWEENSSWLALVELTRDLPEAARVTTRRYPVDFQVARERLRSDLVSDFDFALHLGQAPGASEIALEMFGVNVGGTLEQAPDQYQPLVADGPDAYRSDLPLAAWARGLTQAGLPTRVSYHAGTYLCNALLYLSLHFIQEMGLRTKATFVHLPLDSRQAASSGRSWPSLPAPLCADAVRWIIRAASHSMAELA